ncbi:HAMP domain-containing sensor histidine kinase [Eubacteriaceae bacterium ES2]|nr:HAMP domain-containing sensor histidine kinase [Eubacteriaceae bacterium ES2]
MKINKQNHKGLKKINNPFRSKIAVRLWMIMMLLVILAIAFMWLVQIFLFEHNYVNAAVADLQGRINPMVEQAKIGDLAENTELMSDLSKETNGKMIVISENGEILEMYSAGHQLINNSSAELLAMMSDYIKQSEEYQNISQNGSYERIVRYDSEPIALEIGIAVTYNEKPAVVILYYTLDQLHTVLEINRSQLIRLSIILTIIAGIFAAVLSSYFLKPIRIIKKSVDQLAQGELTASPGLLQKDELGQLSDSVEELSQALQRVDVLRKEVIANVSHELRSPLSLIRGYAEMVRDISWQDEIKRSANLNLIIREATRMSAMVSDILDYSQIQSGYLQLKKENYNLVDIIESEIEISQQTAVDYDIAICLESSDSLFDVNVDAMKISLVMRNLLNNAINHTADHKTVTVRIDQWGQKIRVSVCNPGEPIPAEDRELIWERYQRSQHHGGRHSGTGIGLSIVATNLKAHGMAYGVNSDMNQTSFWFELDQSN